MARQFATLLNTTGAATVAAAAAVWQDVQDMEFPLEIVISGAGAGDGITIAVSNEPLLTSVAGGPNQWGVPAPATVGTPYAAAVVADGVLTILAPVMFIKAYKPAATQSSKVTVLLRGARS